MNRHVTVVEHTQFLKVVKPEIAYLLGFLWADGCIYTKKKYSYLIQVTIITQDFQYIKPILENTGQWNCNVYHPKNPKWKEKTSAAIYSKSIVTYLLSNGFNDKENPHTILNCIPANLHHYFWRGLFDGDGHVSVSNKSYSCGISSSYNQEWTSLEKLCKPLGITYFIRKRVRKKGRCSEFLFKNRKSMVNFLDFIYNGFEHDKIGFLRKYENYLKLKILNMEYLIRRTSKHKGISFVKDRKKWQVNKRINGEDKVFYGFLTENDAVNFLSDLS